MRVFSFGGGVQSTAALVLSAAGKLPYTHFLFSNVGDDSENPDTIRYVNDVIKPFAEQAGLQIITVQKMDKNGDSKTLLEAVMRMDRNIPIPMYINGSPAKRICTSDYKIEIVTKWMRQNAGATKENRVPVGVGISVDESHRMRTDDPERSPYTKIEYPLIDLMLTRIDCQSIIAKAGLSMAPKSSCWFCPFKKQHEWTDMRQHQPELFAKAIELEQTVRSKLPDYQHLWLTSAKRPIEQAVPLPTANMFAGEDDSWDFCESGYCMT